MQYLSRHLANYKGISSSAPTLLRSERWQAGKKEYVIGCTQLKHILEQALGISESIPVTPATIISGLREMHEEFRKRKQGELLFPLILDPKTLRHIQGIPQTPLRKTKRAHRRKHYASL
ncbi:uncharacterized protein VP01_3367g4 [Puccinia sorghi]|uniref:Uncharacterized protein n=1 Tax=Puccinia sorghi TaxID=27349 RepID=A0A0L6UXS0_9BASI|nr:uncharacterized protein VP01_3367g4 [Puccinia sorghi]